MKTLRSEIFFLTVFFISGIQNELRPDAGNVCLQPETYRETIIEKVKKPVEEYKKVRCGKLFKGFSCKKQVTNWVVVDEPRVVQKSRVVVKCCSGYKETQESKSRCVPVCSSGCVHGECTAPDKCTCMPGFHGPTCSIRSAGTKPKKNFVVESSTPEKISKKKEIFQTTEKSELENLALMAEISKVTKKDFLAETTGGATVSMSEPTVTMTDGASYERSTTEQVEKEISKEKFQIANFTVAVDVELILPTLTTASTEETEMNTKYSNLKEVVDLENNIPNSSEKLNTVGKGIHSNIDTTPVLEFEEPTFEPTKTSGKNLQIYDSIYLLYILPVSCFVLATALWMIVKRQKKVRESQKQHEFHLKEPFEFCAENPFWSTLFRKDPESSIDTLGVQPNSSQPILLGLSQCNRSESPTNMWEVGPNNAKPLLKDLQDCDQSRVIQEGTFI